MLDYYSRSQIEYTEKWRDWAEKMPFFKFEPDWEIKIIPPFGGAMARFVVRKGEKRISVYFDTENALGFFYDKDDKRIPYFEIYPFEGDIKRYSINDTELMLNDIKEELDR